MENPNRPHQTIFKFKDSHHYWWTITVWKSGERHELDTGESLYFPNWVWSYTIKREDIEVYHSAITGQSDERVKLREILYDYLCYVSLAIMDGIGSEALKAFGGNER